MSEHTLEDVDGELRSLELVCAFSGDILDGVDIGENEHSETEVSRPEEETA